MPPLHTIPSLALPEASVSVIAAEGGLTTVTVDDAVDDAVVDVLVNDRGICATNVAMGFMSMIALELGVVVPIPTLPVCANRKELNNNNKVKKINVFICVLIFMAAKITVCH